MALGGSTYQVINRQAPKQASDRIVASIAHAIRDAVAAQSPRGTELDPQGHYADGWQVEHIKPGIYRVFNPVPHGRYIEYGTRYIPARPVFGRVIAQVRAKVSR